MFTGKALTHIEIQTINKNGIVDLIELLTDISMRHNVLYSANSPLPH